MSQPIQPNALQNLTPEMQQRLAQIMAGQTPGDNAPAAPTPPAPVAAQAPIVKPPSLMDHIIALRQEVAQLRQQVDANSNVVDAVGQAVGTLYQMFQPSKTNAPGTTFSQGFQQTTDNPEDY